MGEGQYHDSLSGKNSIALTLAQERMESIKNLSFANVNPVALTSYAAPYVDYSYQVVVTPIGALPGQIKDVVVSVSYVAAKQATNPVTRLETYVGNY
jgi:hypothetical protein